MAGPVRLNGAVRLAPVYQNIRPAFSCQGGQRWARVALDSLDSLDSLTLVGNEWHGMSTDFVAGWHKLPLTSLTPLPSLASVGTTAVIDWHSLTAWVEA